MPKLWSETIDAHRADVVDAIHDATVKLAHAHGPLAVTMTQIAKEARIGRATLYKYYPDVAAIFRAWHERHVAEHLRQLSEIAEGPGDASTRLREVLGAYALIRYHRPRDDFAVLHHEEHAADAQRAHIKLIKQLLDQADRDGAVRADIPTGELATFCASALDAAGFVRSRAAANRVADATLSAVLFPADSQDGRPTRVGSRAPRR